MLSLSLMSITANRFLCARVDRLCNKAIAYSACAHLKFYGVLRLFVDWIVRRESAKTSHPRRMSTCCFPVSIHDDIGVAVVSKIALDPFLGWQHTRLNPLVLTRIAFLAQINAFEQGWLDKQGNFFALSKYESAPVHSDERHEEALAQAGRTSTFSTVFVVSMDTTLNPQSNLSLRRRSPAEVLLLIAHVGGSSFTIKSVVMCEKETIGTVTMSFVHVDFASRRPSALPTDKKLCLEAALKWVCASPHSSHAGAMPRQIYGALKASICVTDDLVFAKLFPLRQADFDFNLHLNQSMYQSFAIDTLKEALLSWHLAPAGPVEAWLLSLLTSTFAAPVACSTETGLEGCVINLDSHVTSLRIDYLKEVRMPSARCQTTPPSVVCRVAPLKTPSSFLFELGLDNDALDQKRAFGVLTL